MKKLFTLFAAMLVAVAVNATPIEPGANALSAAISAAEDGATIELNSGDFTESSSISISKNITIKAADMSNKPTLVEGGTISISGDVDVKFEGVNIKADGSHDAFDISAGGIFELDGCEVYNLAGRRAIKVASTAHVDAIKINNCYLHGGTSYCAIEVEKNETQNGCDLVEIKNSTFANFTLGDRAVISISSKGGAIAADPANDVNLIADHCTFYNCTKNNNSTYGCIDLRKSSKATVSNCIFANPSNIPEGRYASRASQLYGGTVSNCLVDANTPNHRSDDITINNALKDVDPKFVDAANGDFHLDFDSPARKAGTESSNLGDPRWWPLHSVSTHAIDFGDVEKGTGSAEASFKLKGIDLTANVRVYDFTLPYGAIFSKYPAAVTPAETEYTNGKTVDVYASIATVGEYNGLIVLESPDFPNDTITLHINVVEPAPATRTLYLTPSIWDVDGDKFAIWDITHSAWSEFMALAEGETNIYAANIPEDAASVIFVRLNGAAETPNWEAKHNQTNDLTLIEGKDMFTITCWDCASGTGNSDGSWSKYTKTPTAIDNTVVEGKAVKMIENGQIVIFKNGIRYNVLGAQIK